MEFEAIPPAHLSSYRAASEAGIGTFPRPLGGDGCQGFIGPAPYTLLDELLETSFHRTIIPERIKASSVSQSHSFPEPLFILSLPLSPSFFPLYLPLISNGMFIEYSDALCQIT